MGDLEGSYRALQTPGVRLGAQFNPGVSTLEPGHSLGGTPAGRNPGRELQIRVQGLDDSQEFFNVDVSAAGTVAQCVRVRVLRALLLTPFTRWRCAAQRAAPGPGHREGASGLRSVTAATCQMPDATGAEMFPS